MANLVPANREDVDFLSDLRSEWKSIPVSQSPWSTTVCHLNELYDCLTVGEVKKVLTLRLFAFSLYEIANGPVNSPKLMKEIFGERLIGQVSDYDGSLYTLLEETCFKFSEAIRNSGILEFRSTHPSHGWASFRKIYVDVLKNGGGNEQIIAGMASTILKDVVRSNPKTWREDSPILSRHRFSDIFRVAFHVFNDEVGRRLRVTQAEILYETIAARLVSFYVRFAADTWRILITRNGPREYPPTIFALNNNNTLQNPIQRPLSRNFF